MKVSRKQLEENRLKRGSLYGWKYSYCNLQSCCEECDKKILFWCRVIRKIEDLQIKRILKICK